MRAAARPLSSATLLVIFRSWPQSAPPIDRPGEAAQGYAHPSSPLVAGSDFRARHAERQVHDLAVPPPSSTSAKARRWASCGSHSGLRYDRPNRERRGHSTPRGIFQSLSRATRPRRHSSNPSSARDDRHIWQSVDRRSIRGGRRLSSGAMRRPALLLPPNACSNQWKKWNCSCII